MLNTTRSLPTRLALRYAALISAGLFQSAFEASRNHARNGCSESAYSRRSQKSLSVLRAIILMPLLVLWHVPRVGARAAGPPSGTTGATGKLMQPLVSSHDGDACGRDGVRFGRSFVGLTSNCQGVLGRHAAVGFGVEVREAGRDARQHFVSTQERIVGDQHEPFAQGQFDG